MKKLIAPTTPVLMILVAALFGTLLGNFAYTADAQKRVEAGCATHVAYDKSGDLVCVDVGVQSARVNQ